MGILHARSVFDRVLNAQVSNFETGFNEYFGNSVNVGTKSRKDSDGNTVWDVKIYGVFNEFGIQHIEKMVMERGWIMMSHKIFPPDAASRGHVMFVFAINNDCVVQTQIEPN